MRMKVYLAGKVGPAKRNFIKEHGLLQIVEVVSSDDMNDLEDKAWNHTPPSKNGLDWSYGYGAEDIVKEYVTDRIEACDILIAYLDTADSYGSIAEIAYASALGMKCFVVFKDTIEGELESGEVEGKRCPAVDAYWLVSCFPNVFIRRADEDFSLLNFVIRHCPYFDGLDQDTRNRIFDC